MDRVMGGSALSFRNPIGQAFVDQADVSWTSITFDGQPEPATSIVLAPYRRDPGVERCASFRDKRYRFVPSGSVPRAVYEISVSLPGTGVDAQEVTYAGMQQ